MCGISTLKSRLYYSHYVIRPPKFHIAIPPFDYLLSPTILCFNPKADCAPRKKRREGREDNILSQDHDKQGKRMSKRQWELIDHCEVIDIMRNLWYSF